MTLLSTRLRAGLDGCRGRFGCVRWTAAAQPLQTAWLLLLMLSGLALLASLSALAAPPAAVAAAPAHEPTAQRSVAAASGNAAGPVTVVDDRGRSITLRRPAQRVVSLLPSLTEALCALQACDRLVGTDRYSNWPEAVKALPRLGGLEDTPIERLFSLKPDVVLAAVSARAIERLEGLGITVVALEPKGLADTRHMLERVAQVLGRPGEGEQLWQRIDQRLGVAASRVPAKLRGQQVYFEVSSAPYAAGEASFVGEVLSRLGMGNIVPAAMGPFPKLNPEFVVRAQPAIVMASARNLAEMPGRPGWGGLAALRDRRACGFEEGRYEVLVRPGPRLAEAAEVIAECLARLGSAKP